MSSAPAADSPSPPPKVRVESAADTELAMWRRSPLPKNWPAIRKRILARDPYCVECLAIGRHTLSMEVDHVNGHDDHSDANLRGLCKWHHSRRTSRQANAARQRVTQRRPAEKHPGLS